MQRFIAAMALTFTLTACDQYNDDKQGAYGGGPTLVSCQDAAACQHSATTAAEEIRATDPDFERKYLDGIRLEDALQQITTYGYMKQKRVRILKAESFTDVLRVHVSMQDADGYPSADTAGLGLTLKRGETELTFVDQGLVPRTRLAISTAMDYSGSMGPALPRLEAANVQLYQALPEAAFAVVKFSDEAHVVAPMGSRPSGTGFESIFMQEFPTGLTALFDGILAGVASHGSRDAEAAGSADSLSLGVVFTDGVENASTATYESAKSGLRVAKIPQIILGMGQVDIKSLITLAEDTNGLFQFVVDGDGIEPAMARVAAAVESIAVVEIPLVGQPGAAGLKPDELVAAFRDD